MEGIETLRTIFDGSGYKLAILQGLSSTPSMTNKQLSVQLGIPYYQVTTYVPQLYRGGLLTRQRVDKRIHYSLKHPEHIGTLLHDLEVLGNDCN